MTKHSNLLIGAAGLVMLLAGCQSSNMDITAPQPVGAMAPGAGTTVVTRATTLDLTGTTAQTRTLTKAAPLSKSGHTGTATMSVVVKGLNKSANQLATGFHSQATRADVDHILITVTSPNLTAPVTQALSSTDLAQPSIVVSFTGLPAGPATMTIQVFDVNNAQIGTQTIDSTVADDMVTEATINVQLDPTPTPTTTPTPVPTPTASATGGSLAATISFTDAPAPSPTPTPALPVLAQETTADGGLNFSTTSRATQTFLAPSYGTVTKLDLMLRAEATYDDNGQAISPIDPANVRIGLYAVDKTGNPIGSPMAQRSVTVSSTTYTWTTVSFPSAPLLFLNTKYAWVLDCGSGAASIASTSGNPYPNGSCATFDTTSDTTWVPAGDLDSDFRLYMQTGSTI